MMCGEWKQLLGQGLLLLHIRNYMTKEEHRAPTIPSITLETHVPLNINKRPTGVWRQENRFFGVIMLFIF
jgi:hypothetical protein